MNASNAISAGARVAIVAISPCLLAGASAKTPPLAPRAVELRVDVAPMPLPKGRAADEMPARVELDFEAILSQRGMAGRGVDFETLRVVRLGDDGKPTPDGNFAFGTSPFDRPIRWYDADVPEQFPDFVGNLKATKGALKPKRSAMVGHFYNTAGSGRRGFLAFTHAQVGGAVGRYVVAFDVLPAGARSPGNGPRGWLGDGQARVGKLGASTTGTGHTRIALDDWDGDGLIDLVQGDENGSIFVFLNVGTKTAPAFPKRQFIVDGAGDPIDVGTHAAPLVIDFDGDDKKDLIVGTYVNRLCWFKNVGTDADRKLEYRGLVLRDDGQPFELPIAPLGGNAQANVFNHDYYPVCEWVDWTGDGRPDLLCGGYVTGRIYLYENAGPGSNGTPKLVERGPIEADGKPLFVRDWCAAPGVGDLNGDGRLDLLTGRTPFGGVGKSETAMLLYFVGTPDGLKERPFPVQGKMPEGGLATPRIADLNGDGLPDVAVSYGSEVALIFNRGTKAEPLFEAPVPIQLAWQSAPLPASQFVDFDRDGRADCFGRFSLWMRSGDANPYEFERRARALPDDAPNIGHPSGVGDDWAMPALYDLDGDGALDVLFGDWHGTIWFHANLKSADSPKAVDMKGVRLKDSAGVELKVGPRPAADGTLDFRALQGARTVFAAGDVDGDGKSDLVIGDTFGDAYYARNAGAAGVPTFEPLVKIGTTGQRGSIDLTDFDGDGRVDVIAGSAAGKVMVFRNTGGVGRAAFAEADAQTLKLPVIRQPRVMMVDMNGDGDLDLYFPSTLGSVLVERSFYEHGYAVGRLVK